MRGLSGLLGDLRMKRSGTLLGILLAATLAVAQPCPRVEYTTTAPTLKSLVAAVNCLSANAEPANAPKAASASKASLQAETFQIVGPQHSRPYAGMVMAVLIVPTAGTLKSAVVTPDTHEATVTAEAGGSCTVKINADKTVDSHCYIAGGTVYILYR
jgi:hypothetical protein